MKFNIPLIKAYKNFIRKKGMAIASSMISNGISVDSIEKFPTPLLSQLYFKRNSKSDINLKELLDEENNNRIDFDKDLNSKKAIEIINEIWPEFGDLLSICLEVVVKRKKGVFFESLSDPKRFGEFVFSFKRTTIFDWIEIIIHEVTHIYHFAITAQPEFKTKKNLKEIQHSSIRNKKRPLIGIYHGLCVETNIILMIDLLEKSKYQIEFGEKLKIKKLFFINKFKSDFSVLADKDIYNFDPFTKSLIDKSNSIVKKESNVS